MRTLILAILLFTITVAYAQEPVLLEYAKYWGAMVHNEGNGCGSGSTCVFGPTPKQFLGLNHTATHGCVGNGLQVAGERDIGLIMIGRNFNNGTWRRGDGFYIEYPFLQGYSYKVTTRMYVFGPHDSDNGARPYLQVQLTNNPQIYNGTFCTVSAEPVNTSNTTNPYAEFHTTDPAIQVHTWTVTFNADQCYSYILYNSYPDDNTPQSVGTFHILEIGIEPTAPNFIVNGPDGICQGTTSATYSIPTPPPGSTINWSLSNGNAVFSTPPTGNQITVTKLTNTGTTVLTATIQTCGKTYTTRPKLIALGIPAAPVYILVSAEAERAWLEAEIDPVPGAISYNWYLNGNFYANEEVTDKKFPKERDVCGVGWAVGVEAVNGCGISARTYAYPSVECENLITLSPNPASNTVYISQKQPPQLAKAKGGLPANRFITQVRIFDPSFKLKKQQQFGGTAQQISLNVAGLQPGIYFVEVYSGMHKETKKLVILR